MWAMRRESAAPSADCRHLAEADAGTAVAAAAQTLAPSCWQVSGGF